MDGNRLASRHAQNENQAVDWRICQITIMENLPVLQKKIDKLQEYISKLLPYVGLSTDELLKNEEKRAAMERWFQLMVDEAVDINAFLVYQISGKVVDSYKSSFHELVPLSVLDNRLAEKIADSAKVRNQMTHDYEKMQYAELIESMKKYFHLYEEYVKIIVDKFIV
jgi:uncharacterized protein YutE (UPF0331/DUF86 family)